MTTTTTENSFNVTITYKVLHIWTAYIHSTLWPIDWSQVKSCATYHVKLRHPQFYISLRHAFIRTFKRQITLICQGIRLNCKLLGWLVGWCVCVLVRLSFSIYPSGTSLPPTRRCHIKMPFSDASDDCLSDKMEFCTQKRPTHTHCSCTRWRKDLA